MQRPLTPLHLKAAALIAEGKREGEVMAACGKSRGWVQNLKRRQDFQETVKQIQLNTQQKETRLQQEVLNSQKEITEKSLEIWLTRQQQLRQQEWEFCQLLISKATEMIQYSLEEKPRWSFKDAGALFEIASRISRLSSEMWSGDVNAAAGLLLRHGFLIIDERQAQEIADGNGDTEAEGSY